MASSNKLKKVTIIEDNVVLSGAYRKIINKTQQFLVEASFESVEELQTALPLLESDIYLVDITLPGINGVEGVKLIKKHHPKVIVIMITVHENSNIVFEALCAGATGYLTKNIDPETLISSLQESVQGGAPMSMKIAKMVVNSFQKTRSSIELSSREIEVLHLLAKGNTYRTIGQNLSVSTNTVKFHLKNIYIKLQVNSNIEAIQKASKENLI